MNAKLEVENKAEHTPTPWEVLEHTHIEGEYWASLGHAGRGLIVDIVSAEGCRADSYQVVAGQKYLVTPVEEQKANAQFIVQACNAHDGLVAMAELFEKVLVYEIEKAKQEGDDEGAELKAIPLAVCRSALALAKEYK